MMRDIESPHICKGTLTQVSSFMFYRYHLIEDPNLANICFGYFEAECRFLRCRTFYLIDGNYYVDFFLNNGYDVDLKKM